MLEISLYVARVQRKKTRDSVKNIEFSDGAAGVQTVYYLGISV
jgi:hypothetical protein